MNTVNLYREEILEHYQEPHNFGKLEKADSHSRQSNPLCGDDIEMFVKFKNGVIGNVRFEGRGCAICMAGASMLTEYALGKSKAQLTKFSENDMLKMLGIKVSETRRKCAMLALAVLKDCLYV
ncbi:iron-sulfur cluster assembly scaffold protein [Candidatus Microgenomates bacterium]|nr:iron-sulfur cluster assembly scaffold protein [Candidatus Microgenomates bacterium]